MSAHYKSSAVHDAVPAEHGHLTHFGIYMPDYLLTLLDAGPTLLQ